jgi:hypothetical protein
LFENNRIVTTKFNDYLQILYLHKDELKVIEKKFNVRVNIEKKLIEPAERKKKGLTRSQSGFDFWRKVVPTESKKSSPTNVQKGLFLIVFGFGFLLWFWYRNWNWILIWIWIWLPFWFWIWFCVGFWISSLDLVLVLDLVSNLDLDLVLVS